MKNFSEQPEDLFRAPEEMKDNYREAQVFHGDRDHVKDGSHEIDNVLSTAFMTARCFAEQTNIPYAKELYEGLCGAKGFVKGEYEPKKIDTPHFLENRYFRSREELHKSLENGEITQVIEIGSGFTPHSIDMLTSEKNLKRYVENDFSANLEIKQSVVNKLIGGLPVRFVAGSILDEKTWGKLKEQLVDGPVGIFCEGLIMYLSRDQQIQLLEHVKDLLRERGGFFMFEDPFKYHKGLNEPRFSGLTSTLKDASNNEALKELYSQEEADDFYRRLGFNVRRVPEVTDDDYSRIDQYPAEVPVEVRDGAHADLKAMQKAGFSTWILSLLKAG